MTQKDPSEFTQNTKDILAKRAGQKCSNPNCRRPTSIAHSDKEKAIMLGEAAHIFGQNSGGKRFDINMTPEQRGDISNGIWLCTSCHKMIDSDEIEYTPAVLHQWRSDHEKTNIENAISKQSIANTVQIPVLDIHHSVGYSGGPKGHFQTFTILNKSDHYAQDCTFTIEGFGYYHDFNIQAGLSLGKNETTNVVFELTVNHTTELPPIIQDLEFCMKYSNIEGQSFISKRKLVQTPVESNVFNILSLGKFVPPTIFNDKYSIISKFTRLGPFGGGAVGLFTINNKNSIKIGISETLLSSWGFTKSNEITTAIYQLGSAKIVNMINLGNLSDYTFTSYDFPQDYQKGYEGYKKAFALLET